MSGTTATIEIRMGSGRKDTFTGGTTATSFTSVEANGASLTRSGGAYVYTARDGTQTTFNAPPESFETGSPVNGLCALSNLSTANCILLPMQTVRPDGGTIDYGFDLWGVPDGSGGTTYEYRLASVANGFGQRIAFSYQSDGGELGGVQRHQERQHRDCLVGGEGRLDHGLRPPGVALDQHGERARR